MIEFINNFLLSDIDHTHDKSHIQGRGHNPQKIKTQIRLQKSRSNA